MELLHDVSAIYRRIYATVALRRCHSVALSCTCTMYLYISNAREGPSVVGRELQNEVLCAKPDLGACG
jgi:hypothetical protein